jgi:hypothetical protein
MRRVLAENGVTISRRALDDTWRYCCAMAALTDITPEETFDLAVAQRILPALLVSAPLELLVQFKNAFGNMPHCQALLTQPLPVLI